MFNYIDKLRKKSPAEKHRAVFVISFSIIFVIASIWIVAWVMKIKSEGLSFTPKNSDGTVDEKTLSKIKESWSKLLEDVNETVDTTVEHFSTTTTEEEITLE